MCRMDLCLDAEGVPQWEFVFASFDEVEVVRGQSKLSSSCSSSRFVSLT